MYLCDLKSMWKIEGSISRVWCRNKKVGLSETEKTWSKPTSIAVIANCEIAKSLLDIHE